MSTRAVTKMEEQMAALMTKIDKQNEHLREQTEQLQLLLRQQVERIDDIASRQVRTDEHVDALDGELQSAKQVLDERIRAIEESLCELKNRANRGPGKPIKKEFLHDYFSPPRSKTVNVLRPTALSFSPSKGLQLVGKGEADVTFVANGGDRNVSSEQIDMTAGEQTDRETH